ncbi:Acetyltransferase, GNAT family [Giardia muris]|uniref:N-alpha-acetyltransferase 60 n=1 Tax=Giardia muris TaxID=5742 RepID=A0A4Z1T672_GIAMU|nr:Acetyltransferase, GNAT family [Giardia muris]|eukprot:TNJ28637.1 Acetyltransferase, GNAT family [Giardia muris]
MPLLLGSFTLIQVNVSIDNMDFIDLPVPEEEDSLRALCEASFPVRYCDRFYSLLVHPSLLKGEFFVRALYRPKPSGRLGRELLGMMCCLILEATDKLAQNALSPLQGWPFRVFLNGEPVLRPYGYLMSIAVTVKRSGLGSRLLQEFETLMWSAGCVLVFLHTSDDNEIAHQFYTHHGYKRVREQRNFYCYGNRIHSGLVYLKPRVPGQVYASPGSPIPIIRSRFEMYYYSQK